MATKLFNPFTSNFDFVDSDAEVAIYDARYLLLDQTTPQTVSGGAPIFNSGLQSNGLVNLIGSFPSVVMWDGSSSLIAGLKYDNYNTGILDYAVNTPQIAEALGTTPNTDYNGTYFRIDTRIGNEFFDISSHTRGTAQANRFDWFHLNLEDGSFSHNIINPYDQSDAQYEALSIDASGIIYLNPNIGNTVIGAPYEDGLFHKLQVFANSSYGYYGINVYDSGASTVLGYNADNLLSVTGTGDSSSFWRGRIVAGGDNAKFLMGEYNSQAWLGAHNSALDSWADFFINPDGGAKLYLGDSGGGDTAPVPIMTVDNTSGNVVVNSPNNTYQLEVGGTAATDIVNSDNGYRTLSVTAPTFTSANLALITGEGGNLDAGARYYYQVTFVTAVGETTASPSAANAYIDTTAGDRKVRVTVPVSDDYRVTARRIYRTSGGGSQYSCTLLTTVNDNSTTTYDDNIADSGLGSTAVYFRNNTTSVYLKDGNSTVFLPGTNATRVGNRAGSDSATGGRNTFVGSLCFFNVSTGSDNVGVGGGVGYTSNPTGCTMVGQYSGGALQGTRTSSTGVGYGTLFGSYSDATRNPDYSTAVGSSAGYAGLGQYGSVFGFQSGYYQYNGSSSYNNFFGAYSGKGASGSSDGQHNSGFGAYSLFGLTTGDYNSAFGNYSGYGITTGSNNVLIGYYAGRHISTESNYFLVNNTNRGSWAAELTNDLIVGVFNATPANQSISFNVGNMNVNGSGSSLNMYTLGTGTDYSYITFGSGPNDSWMRMQYLYSTSDIRFMRSADGSTFTSPVFEIAYGLYTAIPRDISSDQGKQFWGAGYDASIGYDGSSFKIDASEVAASDVHINCGTDKTVVLDEVVYDDIRITPGQFDRAGVSDPAIVSYTPTGSSIATVLYEFQKDDLGYFTVQIPHSYKTGEDIKVHIHWTPGPNGIAENGNTVGWKVDYAWANVNGTFGAMATADLSDACDGTNDKHQMTPEVTITGTDKGISSMLICNIKRTDTGTDDTWGGTASGALPMLLEVDFHYPIDTIGSRDWGTK